MTSAYAPAAQDERMTDLHILFTSRAILGHDRIEERLGRQRPWEALHQEAPKSGDGPRGQRPAAGSEMREPPGDRNGTDTAGLPPDLGL